MKRIILLTIVFYLSGMAIFAQHADMSYYTEEYNRTDATIFDLLDVLEAVKAENRTGIGDFYDNALRILFLRLPNFTTNRERLAVQDSARIIIRGLAAEKHTAAAANVWRLIQEFDVVHDYNDGLLMNEALITMGQINGKDFGPFIALRLESFNADQVNDGQTRRRVQLGVEGAINALEALREPEAIEPVFFASIGWYDPEIRAMAAAALPNIMDDPAPVLGGIIQNPFNDPRVKYTAWQEMLKTKAPNSSKAKVAAVTLDTSYAYVTTARDEQRVLREMRISAIETIRKYGAADNSVYTHLERAYREGYSSANLDFDTIRLVSSTLAVLKTDESVELLTSFLRELNTRRRSGPWGNTERDIMQMIIPAIAITGTQSMLTMQVLATIQNSSDYTNAERNWAGNALRVLAK